MRSNHISPPFFKHAIDYKTKFEFPVHRQTLSRTMTGIENQALAINRTHSIESIHDQSHKQILDDLAFTKASTFQIQVAQDNAYLKSSLKYFHRENQRLIKLIAEKDQKISSIKVQMKDFLIKQNRMLRNQNSSLQKTFRSRSNSKSRTGIGRNCLQGSYRQEPSNRSLDSVRYLSSLKKIKHKLNSINIENVQKLNDKLRSQLIDF